MIHDLIINKFSEAGPHLTRLCAVIVTLFCLTANSVVAFDRFTAHGGPIRHLTQSPDGKYVVSASFDYSAVVWLSENFAEISTLLGHEAALNTAEFSGDGKYLATAGDDGLVLLWRVEQIHSNDQEPIILRGHKGKVVDLAFSYDGKWLVSASWDGTIGLWPLDHGVELAEQSVSFLNAHDGPVNAAQFSADSLYLYSAGYDGHIKYWRLDNLEYIKSIVKNGWGVSSFVVDEAADLVAFGSSDGIMKVESLSTQKELFNMGDERVPILSLHYDSQAKLLGFGNAKGRVLLANTADWSVVRDFHASNGPVWSLLITSSGQNLLVSGLDDYITKWPVYEFPPEFLDKPGPARRFHPKTEMSNGERQFARKCSVCHTLKADGKRRAGPTLYGVFGRRAGTLEGYPYSEALTNSQIVWNAETINRLFSEGPDKVTPGTKMPIQRMKNDQDRRDLVSFLQSATKN